MAVAELDSLQERIGYRFRDPSLLRLSLTHPSLAHEQGASLQHNQRLEFLGDAVLQLILTAEIYAKFPEAGEGVLTKARAQMVNRHSLASQGRGLGLGDHLLLSRGESTTGGRGRGSTLADAFEALVGAIFLDGGYEAVHRFVLDHFRNAFGALDALPSLENPKGELQEKLQADSSDPPHYRLETMSGPDHDRVFQCAVYHRGCQLGRGEGKSKKDAESAAARAALATLAANTPTDPAESAAPGVEQAVCIRRVPRFERPNLG